MEDTHSQILVSLKGELNRLFFISIGVFLFVLFFQPFPLEQLKTDNRLLYVTGFGGINFLLACIIFILIPLLFSKERSVGGWESGSPLILNFLLLSLTSTAFGFYIRFVGSTPVTFYIMFKVVLICLLPLIILIILYKNKSLERIIDTLKIQNKSYFARIKEYEKLNEDENIEILSTNKFEKLSLKYKSIIYIKSADNYIVIFYEENGSIEKMMIRNTLKNIENQFANYPDFVRCHRTCIVNMQHVEKRFKEYGSFYLKINQVEEKLPISRQYLKHFEK